MIFGGPIEWNVGGGQDKIGATWYNTTVSQDKLGMAGYWVGTEADAEFSFGLCRGCGIALSGICLAFVNVLDDEGGGAEW